MSEVEDDLRDRVAALERRLERQMAKRDNDVVLRRAAELGLHLALAEYVRDMNIIIRNRRRAGDPVTTDELRHAMAAAGIHVYF
jgi:hypothetical protein